MKDLLFQVGPFQAYAIQGSIFDEKDVDVLALFRYPGLAALPINIKCFLFNKGLEEEQNVLLHCEGKHGNVKAVYYVDSIESTVKEEEATYLIHKLLDAVSKARYTSIAMNGIRMSYSSEAEIVRIIRDWVMVHPESPIKTILLVDLKGGFNKLAKMVRHC
ncbi:MAG: hypothetical protein IKX45_03470 [Bacteroidales bacterium]|nr:hypothetical protein [Bacteroidales bacterium]